MRVEAYLMDGDSHYISLWVRDDCTWRMHNKMTRAQYLDFLNNQYKDRFVLIHLDAHAEGGDTYYSGIWWEPNGEAWRVRSNRNWYLFQRFFNNNWCDGYEIDNFYAADVPGAVRYGGIWTFDEPLNIDATSPVQQRIKLEVNCAPAHGGAAVVNFTTGDETFVHADQIFGTSSTIKIPVLYALLRLMDASGNVSLDTTLNVGAQYGSNGPQGANVDVVETPNQNCTTNGNRLVANSSYSLRCLAQLMIRLSHNWATNRLIDFVGMNQINQEMDNLNLDRTRIQRYMIGSGPSPNGATDYANGIDVTTTPREMVTLLSRVHTDAILPENSPLKLLTDNSWTFFWNTLILAGGNIDNLLGQGVAPNWTTLVTIFRKPGSNCWGWSNGCTAPAVANVGAYAHRPQIGAHLQRSEAGRFTLSNGQVVFYALYFDEADGPRPPPPTPLQNAIACIGNEVVREYAATTSGMILPQCQ